MKFHSMSNTLEKDGQIETTGVKQFVLYIFFRNVEKI